MGARVGPAVEALIEREIPKQNRDGRVGQFDGGEVGMAWAICGLGKNKIGMGNIIVGESEHGLVKFRGPDTSKGLNGLLVKGQGMKTNHQHGR